MPETLTAPEEITFEEASAPEAPEEITFEEGHGVDPEAIKRGIQLGTGLTQTIQRAITNPAAAEASEMGRQEGEFQRLMQPPVQVQPPREVIGPMPGREASEPFKMGDYTLTPVQEGIGIPYVRSPKEAGIVEKTAAGLFNTAAGIPNFMLSLPGLATTAAPAALPARFIQPALKIGFGAMMATATEQAVRKAWKTKNPQDIAEAIGAGGFTALILKGRTDPEFQQEVLKQQRLKRPSILPQTTKPIDVTSTVTPVGAATITDEPAATPPPPVPKTTTAEPAKPQAAIKSVEDFSKLLEDPNASPRNNHSIEAGLSAKTVADLDTLAALRDKYTEAYKKSLSEAQKPGVPTEERDRLFNEALKNTNRAQVSREAIEAATNTGSWVEGQGALEPIQIGERPLDWKKDKEVSDWLAKNGERLGIDIPDEIKSKPTEAEPTTPKLTEDQVRDLVAKASEIVRTRKLEPADKRALGVEMENARAGAPEKLQELIKRLSVAEPKVAPKQKGGPLGRFRAETEAHGDDILSWIESNMKLLSKSGAKKSGKFAANASDWDDAPSQLAATHHGVIYSEAGFSPNQVAETAFREGQIGAPTASALWAAIKAASAKRKGAVEGAARQAKILAESGPQLERWQAQAPKPSESHPIELTTEELKVGDTIKVGGETLRVSERDPDSGDVTLVNGDKFGTQTLAEGEKIYAAEHIEKPTTETPGEVFSQEEQSAGQTEWAQWVNQLDELTLEEKRRAIINLDPSRPGGPTPKELERWKAKLLEVQLRRKVGDTTREVKEESSQEEHPGGEAGAAIQSHGTTTGLPPGVADGGKDFGSELMAAAQRLGTIVRTRSTLKSGVLGQYSRSRAGVKMSDKIEVGELSNQNTMAHEMGHDLDQLLWPGVDLAYPMKTLADREGIPGNGKALHTELLGVSELMRGPIKGSKAYVEYRKRAAELIADHFALYAHDPARAHAMAPKWTKVLEDALARNKNAQETIQQLHAGFVVPVPGEGALPPTGPAAGMPGKVPPILPPPPVSPDANLFNAAAGVVKGLWRKFKSEVIRGQIVADGWRKLVPDPVRRGDVGAAVEGIGNLEIPGDTIDAVMARMTPAMAKMQKLYKYAIENVRGKVNQYLKGMTEGEYLAFLRDYLPHFYDTKSVKGQQALGRFIKNSPNAKERKIPTLQEAVGFGLTPITQDPAVLYELWSRVNWRVATNRMLVGQLGEMRTAAGEKVLVPWSEAPPGYIRSDNPLIQRVYAMQGKGGTMLWRGGAGIHPDAWTAVRQMLEMPTSSKLASAYDAVNSITRANAFAFSLFHDMTLRFASAGTQWSWYNPFRGLFRIFEKNPLTGDLDIFRSAKKVGQELLGDEQTAVDAARHGLVFSFNDSESYQMAARDFLDQAAARWKDNPILGTPTRLARDLQHWRQKNLWKNTHDAYKILAYQDITSKALADAPPGTNPSVVKEQVASMLNDAFGGQEWQTKFWLSPQNRRMLSRFFLAPDWTFSTGRSVPFVSDIASIVRANAPRIVGREPIPTVQEGLGGNLGRLRFWGGELAAIATATVAAQYAIYNAFGKKDKGDKPWIWENEDGQRRRVDITPIMRKMPWKDPNDPTRYYMNLGKRPEEILGYVTHFDQNLMSKASRPVAEIMRQVTGTEGDFKAQWKRDHETFLESIPERALKAGGQLVPFVFSGNQFAFSVPYRKGMIKYKAQQAYESVYELAADPGVWPQARAFLRGVPAPDGTLTEMVEKITDAAERNGVPAERIRRRALSVIRGKYEDRFAKASKKLDAGPSKTAERDLDKAAQALENLGATGHQIFESLKRRKALEPSAE